MPVKRNLIKEIARTEAPQVGLTGQSLHTRQLNMQIRRIANTNLTVLIQGETGTGKELVARCVHAWSDRADHPFIAVDCGALSESLIESELFGHRKGAFTGA
jgi:transcriptional regulator with GAF, ATPase, and Fis domain